MPSNKVFLQELGPKTKWKVSAIKVSQNFFFWKDKILKISVFPSFFSIDFLWFIKLHQACNYLDIFSACTLIISCKSNPYHSLSFTFMINNLTMKHLKKLKKNEISFQCEICDKKFKTNIGLPPWAYSIISIIFMI